MGSSRFGRRYITQMQLEIKQLHILWMDGSIVDEVDGFSYLL